MAELAALASCAQLHLQKSCFKASVFVSHNVFFKILDRKHFQRKCGYVRLPSQQVYELGTPLAMTSKGSPLSKELPLRCCCLGTFTSNENLAPLSWIAIVDQVLLMTTVAFAYMAGVIPTNSASFTARKRIQGQDAGIASSTSSGSAIKSKKQANSESSWDEVRQKLLNALDAIELDDNLDSGAFQFENNSATCPLSLYAIADGPRLRLLWATLQRLQKEVNRIPGINESVSKDIWLVVLSETIRSSLQPVCLRWLDEELYLESRKLDLESRNLDKDLFAMMFERLKGDDTILENIKRLGKEDLYADLLFFLRFGFLRIGCQFDSKLLTDHGADILEDLVITLADGITSLYLELISVDSSMSSEMNSLGLNLCSLSTRALQRLRNEVALKQWMHQNIESVISMYEDRFDLLTLQTQLLEESNKSRTDNLRWWKKLTFRKPPVTSSPLYYVVISNLYLPVKRTKELRALTGWRYYYSLYLELSDITMPLVSTVVTKISSAISFFLVTLIGRSLGLIYTGIRQALGWK